MRGRIKKRGVLKPDLGRGVRLWQGRKTVMKVKTAREIRGREVHM